MGKEDEIFGKYLQNQHICTVVNMFSGEVCYAGPGNVQSKEEITGSIKYVGFVDGYVGRKKQFSHPDYEEAYVAGWLSQELN